MALVAIERNGHVAPQPVPFARTMTGQAATFADHVRLVRESEMRGDVRPARPIGPLSLNHGRGQPLAPQDRSRRETQSIDKAASHMPRAQPDRLSQLRWPDCAFRSAGKARGDANPIAFAIKRHSPQREQHGLPSAVKIIAICQPSGVIKMRGQNWWRRTVFRKVIGRLHLQTRLHRLRREPQGKQLLSR